MASQSSAPSQPEPATGGLSPATTQATGGAEPTPATGGAGEAERRLTRNEMAALDEPEKKDEHKEAKEDDHAYESAEEYNIVWPLGKAEDFLLSDQSDDESVEVVPHQSATGGEDSASTATGVYAMSADSTLPVTDAIMTLSAPATGDHSHWVPASLGSSPHPFAEPHPIDDWFQFLMSRPPGIPPMMPGTGGKEAGGSLPATGVQGAGDGEDLAALDSTPEAKAARGRQIKASWLEKYADDPAFEGKLPELLEQIPDSVMDECTTRQWRRIEGDFGTCHFKEADPADPNDKWSSPMVQIVHFITGVKVGKVSKDRSKKGARTVKVWCGYGFVPVERIKNAIQLAKAMARANQPLAVPPGPSPKLAWQTPTVAAHVSKSSAAQRDYAMFDQEQDEQQKEQQGWQGTAKRRGRSGSKGVKGGGKRGKVWSGAYQGKQGWGNTWTPRPRSSTRSQSRAAKGAHAGASAARSTLV